MGRDAGVIGAGEPKDFVTLHALATGEDVLQRVVEHMTHRQDAGHIWGRDDDGIGRLRGRRIGGEVTFRQPVGVPLVLYEFRVVGFRNLCRCSSHAVGNYANTGAAWQASKRVADEARLRVCALVCNLEA